MVEMIEPFEGEIFDAACGSGGMFVQSLKCLQQMFSFNHFINSLS